MGSLGPKISGRWVAPTNHSFCFQNYDKHIIMWQKMWAQLSFVLSQITHLTDGQTDGRTDSFLVARLCTGNACSTENTKCRNHLDNNAVIVLTMQLIRTVNQWWSTWTFYKVDPNVIHEKHEHLSINYNKLEMSLTCHLFSSRHCQHSQLHYNNYTVSNKTQQFTSGNNSCQISESIVIILSPF